jgi:hypothetical protein
MNQLRIQYNKKNTKGDERLLAILWLIFFGCLSENPLIFIGIFLKKN